MRFPSTLVIQLQEEVAPGIDTVASVEMIGSAQCRRLPLLHSLVTLCHLY